jgi:ribosome maturation factor RimP
MDKTEELKQLFAPVFENTNVKLYEIKWISGKENTLEVSIMKEDGTMDLDTCADISEKLSEILDAKDPINEEYTLEVCSPGAEREIKDLNELAAGQYVFVRLKEPFKNLLEFTGEIESVEGTTVTLKYRDKAAKRKAVFEKENIDLIRMAVKI